MMHANVPKDRGWAWMCNLGSCLSMFFVIGAFKSLGILFVEFIDLYKTSSGMTAWVMGLTSAGMSLLSPVASALSESHSNRLVVMVGACFSIAAPLICVAAPNIYFIVIVFGLCSGIGNALMFTPSMIIVSQYFDKHRSLANGFTMAGGSLGQLVIPILLNYWLKTYALQGTLLLYAGLFTHGLLAGALMRPVGFYKRCRMSKHSPEEMSNHKDLSGIHEDKVDILLADGDTVRGVGRASSERQLTCTGEAKRRSRNYSDGDQEGLCGGDVTAAPHGGGGAGDHTTSTGSLYIAPYPLDMIAAEPALRRASHVDSDTLQSQTSSGGPLSKLCGMYAWELLRDPLFLTYVFAICLGNVGYVDTILFMPPLAHSLGVDRDVTAVLMFTIGLSDLFSRLVGGWLADHAPVRRNFLTGLYMATMGLTSIVCVVVSSVTSLFVMCVAIGTCGGLYAAIFPIVLIDYLGMAEFPRAFGMAIMFMGFTNIALPSFLGKLSDVTGSYCVPYVICGTMMTISAVFFYIEPCIRRQRHNALSADGATSVERTGEKEIQRQ